jgi:hypothetical protein
MRRYSTTVGPRITSILRVNKRIAEEATNVLYRANLFKTSDVHRFIRVFVKDPRYGIGPDNAAKITHVCFGLPSPVAAYPIYGYQSLLDFLCTELINLKELTLTNMTMHDMVTAMAQKDTIKHAHMGHARELMFVAAIITKFHPILRKAVWRRWSGSTLTKDNDVGVYDGGMEDPVFIRGEWFIDLVPEGHTAVLEGSVTVKDSSGEDTQSEVCLAPPSTTTRTDKKTQDMVINSRFVRRAAWHDVNVWFNMRSFALPSDATSSEVDADQVVTWPGTGEDGYDLESEVDPLSLAAAKQSYGRKRKYSDSD